MPWRKILSLVGPVACTACLAVGYAMIEQWLGLAAALFALLIWILARQKPDAMPPSIALVLSTIIAAGGLLAGAAPVAMILGSGLALASWDLVLLYHSLASSSGSSAVTLSLFERIHIQYLMLAIGASLLVAISGRLLHPHVPFGVLVLLAMIALFSLDRILRTLINVQ